MATEGFTVEVVCAEADRQTVIVLKVMPGCTAGEALERSGVLASHPGIDPAACAVGIFGREVPPGWKLKPGDRVEVLRPLAEDPRARRRRLARQGRTMGRRSAGSA